MIRSKDLLEEFGDPRALATQIEHFELWVVEEDIQKAFSHVRFTALGTLGFPKKIFINKKFKPVLKQALLNLIERRYTCELKTWDGVFVIRKQTASASLSTHSWAVSVDVNAEENGYGMIPKLSEGFVKCFTDAGCDWGGDWLIPDGMHFQMKKQFL